MIAVHRGAMVVTTTAFAATGRRNFTKSLKCFKSTIDAGTAVSRSAARTATLQTKGGASVTETSMFSKAMSFPKDHPFAFQLFVATAKTSAADLVVQVVAERKSLSEIDWKRNGIFVVFGFAYLGGFQYWLMVNKYRQWFPTMEGCNPI